MCLNVHRTVILWMCVFLLCVHMPYFVTRIASSINIRDERVDEVRAFGP
jgi:hypothetical protein